MQNLEELIRTYNGPVDYRPNCSFRILEIRERDQWLKCHDTELIGQLHSAVGHIDGQEFIVHRLPDRVSGLERELTQVDWPRHPVEFICFRTVDGRSTVHARCGQDLIDLAIDDHSLRTIEIRQSVP